VVRGPGLRARQQAQLQRDRGPNDRFGIIASGKAYNDTRQALVDLGLDDDTCRQLGIRVHKVNVVWPLEATITRDFAQGLQEILVVEEKRQVIEYQLKEELYNWRADVRPNVLGKFDEPEGDISGGEWSMPNPSQNWLLRAKADLTPALIAKAIAKRLKKLGVSADIVARMDARLAIIEASERAMTELKADTGERAPVVLQRLPAQHQHARARGLARRGRHRLPLHDGVDGPQHQHLHADGRRGRVLGGPAPFTEDASMCSPTWATAPTSTAACWPSARASRPG
jgi:TPP-dependent indolepyruvate ferredoxin oxidoreductase alpha subunit